MVYLKICQWIFKKLFQMAEIIFFVLFLDTVANMFEG